jgi:hypothetical protein
MSSVVLEVAIGLALLFYVSATLVSGVAEGITRLLSTRSKLLWAALARLLATEEGPTSLGPRFMAKSLVPKGPDPRPLAAVAPTANNADEPPVSAASRLAELAAAPSIRGLEYVANGKTAVANIPGKVFATALLELATTKAEGGTVQEKLIALAGAYSGSPLGGYLKTIAGHVGNDIDKATNAISDWFDQQMTRVSQTYRRNMKYVLAALGLAVALLCNVDSINVAQGLANNAGLRQVITATADDITKADITAGCTSAETDTTRKTLDCGLQKLAAFEGTGVVIPFSADWTNSWTKNWQSEPVATHLLGLGLTTGALALGGPMWFDFLMLLTGRKKAN